MKLIDIKNEFLKFQTFPSEMKSEYKLKNLAMAIQAAKLCGLKERKLYNSVNKITDISGRLELIKKYPNDIKVFIDYAHTPDALLKTIKSLKLNYGHNISLVFGCGGNRDKKKRPLMAKIANDYCKKVYITDDNPRDENPNIIRNELSKYIQKEKLSNIGDRSVAIKKAIQNANPQEIILVAGKGHEDKQIYKKKIKYISDKQIIKNLKIKKNFLSKNQKIFLQNSNILRKIFDKKNSLKVKGLSIDTRSIKKDNLFLAIKGKNSDGSKFIKDALKKGAGGVITSSKIRKKK